MAFPLSDAQHVAIREMLDGQPEMIVAAAIRWGRVVVMAERPGRHGDCIWPMHHAKLDHSDHGFVTNRGRFVDREEAARIVVAAGQTTPREGMKHLFSEDVWNDSDTEMADQHTAGKVQP
jgi:hypothetical protein